MSWCPRLLQKFFATLLAFLSLLSIGVAIVFFQGNALRSEAMNSAGVFSLLSLGNFGEGVWGTKLHCLLYYFECNTTSKPFHPNLRSFSRLREVLPNLS